jgi:hypothetical protein
MGIVELTPTDITISIEPSHSDNVFGDWVELNKELTTIYQLIVTNQDYPVHEAGLVWFPKLVSACASLSLPTSMETKISEILTADK